MALQPPTFVPKPGLYLVATPIGNRRDITLRALDVLRAADIVACEDTRVTGGLLAAFGIKKPLMRCDAVTEAKQAKTIIAHLSKGGIVALCSDAGSPLISDPGAVLVTEVRKAGHLVTAIPGASSVITALQLSGLPPLPFSFLGFVPQKGRKGFFEAWQDAPGTLVVFERSSRLQDTIDAIRETLGERDIVLTRELTKMYEEILPIKDVAPEVKGECVLVIGPRAVKKKISRNEIYKQKLAAKHADQL